MCRRDMPATAMARKPSPSKSPRPKASRGKPSRQEPGRQEPGRVASGAVSRPRPGLKSRVSPADLGRKTGRFYPAEERARVEVEEWLMWQTARLGPMAGQADHFRQHAPEPVAYAIEYYTNECAAFTPP